MTAHTQIQSFYHAPSHAWLARCECGWQSRDEKHADHLASLGADHGLGVRGARITPADRPYTGPDFSDEACGFVRVPMDCTCYDPRSMEWAPNPCAKCEADELEAAADDYYGEGE